MRSENISRREFLAAAGVGYLYLLTDSWGAANEIGPPPARFMLEWGKHGKAEGEFNVCVGIAIGKDDIIHTAEFFNQRVQKFNTDGKFLGMFAVQPFATGIAVDGEGNVYVAHWNANKLAAYSPEGKLLREWGKQGTGDGEFQLPGSVALGPDGLLYVPDQGNSRVQKFTTDGKFVGKWGSRGKEPGQFGGDQPAGGRFAGPQFAAFDRAGNVYTTDPAMNRVQKFTPAGKLLGFWGSESSEPGGFGPPMENKPGVANNGFSGPIALCVDSKDRVWVGGTNDRVQQFTNDGKFLQGIGGRGTGPGRFHTPHGLALDGKGCLYVADTMNFRIQKFDVG